MRQQSSTYTHPHMFVPLQTNCCVSRECSRTNAQQSTVMAIYAGAVSISLCAEQVCTKTNGKLMMNISTYLKNIQRYAHVVPVRHEKDTSTDAR